MSHDAPTTRIMARLAACMLVASFAAPVAGWAQKPPLAEIAKKEQERRKTTKDAPKKLTNKDLPESALKPQAPTPPSAGHAAGEPQATGEPQAAPAAEGKPAAEERGEQWWRGRIEQARENLRRNQAFLEALQSRVNGLTTDFVNRDDPYQRAKIGEDRQKALDEMERVKTEIAAGQKQIEAIEEEARKAGVPPGWLR
jgi:hypothetical protein